MVARVEPEGERIRANEEREAADRVSPEEVTALVAVYVRRVVG
jgi:hypothetical protein